METVFKSTNFIVLFYFEFFANSETEKLDSFLLIINFSLKLAQCNTRSLCKIWKMNLFYFLFKFKNEKVRLCNYLYSNIVLI